MRLSSSRALASAVASLVSLGAVVAVTACGGGSAQSSGPASPGGGTSAAAAADGGTSSAIPSAAPSSATTTTVTLGDAGDLQGTKLQSTSGGSSAFDAPDAGPERGAHGGEPGRSVKDIQTIVQSHRDDARACYDRVQQAHPDPMLKGNLDVKWTIDPTGKVTEISVDDSRSDIHDAAIGKCVMDVIKGIHFSVSGKGFETRAHYPFNFNPHNVRTPAGGAH